jgi:uncharacterized protein YgiM (DUF1202 family)
MSDYIGRLVKPFESGTKGSLALGQCGNDWGLSCGSYQLTLRWGNCINFLKKYFPTESSSLYFNNRGDVVTPTYPGSDYCSSPDEVKTVWTNCYNKVGADKFFSYEHEYIKLNYFDKAITALKNIYLPANRAMEECIWSWAVHKGYGGCLKYIKEVIAENNITDAQNYDQEKLFTLFYDKRYKVDAYNRYDNKSGNSSERVVLTPYLKENTLGSYGITKTTTVTITPITGVVMVTYTGSDGLNVRTSPSMSSSVSKIAYNGEFFNVVGISSDKNWYKLDNNLYITAGDKYVKFVESVTPTIGGVKMKIIENMMTKNTCYTNNIPINVEGFALHSIGVGQPSASVLINNYNNPNTNGVAVHGFIEPTGNCYITLPCLNTPGKSIKAGHCGSGTNGSGNNNYIAFEMTEPSTIKYKSGSAEFVDNNPAATKQHVLKCYDVAVQFFAYLCVFHKKDPTADGVILSHYELHQRGLASGHVDPHHLWNLYGLTMDQFRKDVKKAMSSVSISNTTTSNATSTTISNSNSITASSSILPLTGTLKVIYKGSDGLNVRTGPGTNYSVSQTIKSGSFTIVGISADKNWYKLKSGLYISSNPNYVSVTLTGDTSNQKILDKSGTLKIIYKGADGINVRVAPSMTAKVDQVVKSGSFTVVGISVDGAWYKLKSGLYITSGTKYVKLV